MPKKCSSLFLLTLQDFNKLETDLNYLLAGSMAATTWFVNTMPPTMCVWHEKPQTPYEVFKKKKKRKKRYSLNEQHMPKLSHFLDRSTNPFHIDQSINQLWRVQFILASCLPYPSFPHYLNAILHFLLLPHSLCHFYCFLFMTCLFLFDSNLYNY